jgi:hypothetical protein
VAWDVYKDHPLARVLAPWRASRHRVLIAIATLVAVLGPIAALVSAGRYDLNLWIDHPLEGATYLPR